MIVIYDVIYETREMNNKDPWLTFGILQSNDQEAVKPLQWRHNDHDCVSNHQPHDC